MVPAGGPLNPLDAHPKARPPVLFDLTVLARLAVALLVGGALLFLATF